MTRFTLFLLLLCSGFVRGQNPAIDQLKTRLEQTSGKEKVKVCYALGNHFMYVDSAAAGKYFTAGTELAKKKGYRALEIEGEWSLTALEDYYGLHFQSLNRAMNLCRRGGLSRKDSCMVMGTISASLEALGAFEMAISYSKKALKLQEQPSPESRYYAIEFIAQLYSRSHQFDSANYYYKKSLTEVKKCSAPGLVTHCLNNIGSNYLEQGNLSSAKYFFDRALNNFHVNARYSGDSTLYAVVYNNLAKIHDKKGQLKAALEKRQEAVRMILLTHIAVTDRALRVYLLLQLAQSEIRSGLLQDARKHIDAVHLEDADPEGRMTYYAVLADYYEKAGKTSLSLQALRKRAVITENILYDRQLDARLNEFVRFQNEQITFQLNEQRKARWRMASINRKELNLTVGIAVFLAAIFAAAFIVYRKNQATKYRLSVAEHNLNEQQLKFRESQAERLTLELELKNKDLFTFAINITKKHEFTSEMAQKLQKLRRKNAVEKTDLNELIAYVKSFQAVDNGLFPFQKNIEEINRLFLERLTEKYPELTQNEIELCLLIRLKLSSKDIAIMKNITSESVNVLRSRLRKKMHLDSRDDLYEAIERL